MAASGRTRVYIDADADALEREIRRAEMALARLGRDGARAGTAASAGMEKATLASRTYARAAAGASAATARVGTAARTASPYLAAGLALGLAKSVSEAREAEKAMSQTEAVIKSTGGTANVSAKQIAELSNAISLKAGIDDEAIQSGANLLLTFTNIRNEVGKGNKIFDQSTQLVTDMSVALGTDLKSASLQLGKALQDPTTGLTALRRSGVAFTEQQQDQIKVLFESGKRLQAQKMILKEVATEFGGSAAAQADSFDKLQVAGENFAESVGKKVTPVLGEMADELSDILSNKKLTGDQRMSKIGDFFEEWVGKGIDALSDAAPEIASTGAKLAGKMISGFAHAFVESDTLGKLFLGAAALRFFGGPGVFGSLGSAMGKRVVSTMATTVATQTAVTSRWSGLRSGALSIGKGILGINMAMGLVAGLTSEAPTIQGKLEDVVSSVTFGIVPSWSGENDAQLNALKTAFEQGLGNAGLEEVLNDHLFGSPGTYSAMGIEGLAKNLSQGLVPSLSDVTKGMDKARQTTQNWHTWLAVLRDDGRITDAQMEELGSQVDSTFKSFASGHRDYISNLHAMRRGVFTSMGDINSALKENEAQIDESLGKGSARGREELSKNYRIAADNVQRMMDRGEISVREGTKRMEGYIRKAKIVDATRKQARDFAHEWSKGMDDASDFTGKGVDSILDDLRKMPPASRDVAIKTWLAQLREAARQNPKLKDEFRDLRSKVVSEFGLIRDKSDSASEQMAARVAGNVNSLANAVTGGLAKITSNTNEALKGFGVKPLSFAFDTVGKAAQGKQQGGPVMVPGYGSGDSFHAAVPEGTFILNREAVNAFFGLQRGGSVPVALEPGELAFPPEMAQAMGGLLSSMNAAVPRFASGGAVGDIGGLQPGILQLAAIMANKFGMQVTSGLRAGDSGSLHSTGQAADFAGGNFPAASQYANSIGSSLLEGIYNPGSFGGSPVSWDTGQHVDSGYWGSEWGNHLDHIHTAIAGKGGNLPAGATRDIARVLLKGPKGPLREMGQAGLDKARKAANAYIASKMPALTEGARGVSADGNVAQVFAQVARKLGAGKRPTLALFEAGVTESGMRDLSYGDASSQGSLQLLASTAAGMGIDPHNEGEVASAFLTRGYWGKGGAMSLAEQNPQWSAGTIAQNVQGSAYPERYDQNKGAALSVMRSVGLQRGGFAGGGKAGKGGKGHGSWWGVQGGVKAPQLSYEEKLTRLEIALSNAEQTDRTADDLRILAKREALLTGRRDEIADDLDGLHVTGDDRRAAAKAAEQRTAALEKKLREDGFTKHERQRLRGAQVRVEREVQESRLAGRRKGLLESLNGLTGEVNGTRDQIKSLKEQIEDNNVGDLIEAINGLKVAQEESNRLIGTESAVQKSQLMRAIADLLEGEIGGRASFASTTAGYGSVVAA